MKGIFAAGLLSLACTGAADAAKYDFVARNQLGVAAVWGVLTTSDTLNAVGGYDVTGITGTGELGDIVGLIANPAQPDTGYYYVDGHTDTVDTGAEWIFDNVLFDNGGPWFSQNGLLFQTADVVYNLATYQGQDYLGVSGVGTWSATEWYGSFEVTREAAPAPEPASWALMVGGFALAGAALRRKRATVRFA